MLSNRGRLIVDDAPAVSPRMFFRSFLPVPGFLSPDPALGRVSASLCTFFCVYEMGTFGSPSIDRLRIPALFILSPARLPTFPPVMFVFLIARFREKDREPSVSLPAGATVPLLPAQFGTFPSFCAHCRPASRVLLLSFPHFSPRPPSHLDFKLGMRVVWFGVPGAFVLTLSLDPRFRGFTHSILTF